MNGIKAAKLSYDRVDPKQGAKEGSHPVVLVHGLAQTKDRWKDSLQNLADRCQRIVYAVDLRNHGDSEQTDFFDLNVLAVDLHQFIVSQGIKKAALVGHSIGGIAIMDTALTMPDKVDRIVVEDTSPKMLLPEVSALFAELLREQIECLEGLASAEEEFVHRLLRECIYRTIPMIPDEDYEVLEKMRFPIRKKDSGYEYRGNLPAVCRAFQDWATLFRGYSGEFAGEALFVYGGSSTMRVGEDKELILKHFPNAKLKCIPKAGHEVYASNPEDFVSTLVDFLKTE